MLSLPKVTNLTQGRARFEASVWLQTTSCFHSTWLPPYPWHVSNHRGTLPYGSWMPSENWFKLVLPEPAFMVLSIISWNRCSIKKKKEWEETGWHTVLFVGLECLTWIYMPDKWLSSLVLLSCRGFPKKANRTARIASDEEIQGTKDAVIQDLERKLRFKEDLLNNGQPVLRFGARTGNVSTPHQRALPSLH